MVINNCKKRVLLNLNIGKSVYSYNFDPYPMFYLHSSGKKSCKTT